LEQVFGVELPPRVVCCVERVIDPVDELVGQAVGGGCNRGRYRNPLGRDPDAMREDRGMRPR